MTFQEFHNALRILLNIDMPEFVQAIDALGARGDPAEPQWPRFRDNPHDWFIKAPTLQAEAIWKIVERRQLQSVHKAVRDYAPLVLFFTTPEDRAEFIATVKEAKPNMISEAVEL